MYSTAVPYWFYSSFSSVVGVSVCVCKDYVSVVAHGIGRGCGDAITLACSFLSRFLAEVVCDKLSIYKQLS